MDHYPPYATYALWQIGYEDDATRIESCPRRWGGLELEAFIRALHEGEDEDKVLAIWALGYEPAAWVREYLLPFLRSTEPMERWASAFGLEKMGEPQALPVLLRMLKELLQPQESPSSPTVAIRFCNCCRGQHIFLLTHLLHPH